MTSNALLGELVEESGSEDEEDGDGGAEEYEKEQREKLEQERAAIMSDSTLIAEVSGSLGVYLHYLNYCDYVADCDSFLWREEES